MKLILIIFCASLIPAITKAKPLNPKLMVNEFSVHKYNDLAESVQFYFDNYFFKHHKEAAIITAVKDQNDAHINALKQSILINLKNNGLFYVVSLENHTSIKSTPEHPRYNMVIIIDTFESYSTFLKSLTLDRFNLHGHYLFVLVNGLFNEEDTKEFTSSIWTNGIIYFYVIIQNSGFVNVATIRPYDANLCPNTNLLLLNTYKDAKFENSTKTILYPKNKFYNLKGCPIRFVTFERCPAMCYNKERNTFSGYDYEIIKAIEKRLNFNMNLTYISGSEQWGTILPDGSTTGGLDVLRKGNANVGVGNYFLRLSRLKYFDASISYYSVPIVLVIPPPSRLSPFEKLLRPFDKIIWILLVVVFSIGVLIILVINLKLKKLKNFVYGRKVKSPAMNMIVSIFGQQQRILPTRNFARFILMNFLIFCLVNRNVYQGALYIFLQSDGRHKEIQSIDEMIAKDFKFYVYGSYTDFIHEGTKMYKNKIVINSEHQLPFSREVDDTLKGAFVTPLTNVMNRNEMARGKFALRVCKEKISVLTIVMYMSKGFYLKEIFDQLLLQYDCNGLLTYWFNQYAQKRYLNISSGNSGPIKLNMEHLFGVFNVMLIGHGIALIIFIFEHLVFQFKQLKSLRVQNLKLDKKNKVKNSKKVQKK